MGSKIRILIGPPADEGLGTPQEAGRRAREFILGFDQKLSRFKPESELTSLNRDPRPGVPASELLRSAVKAGLWAAERTGGLVDPTLVDEIESAGYVESRAGLTGVPVVDALDDAPARQVGRPSGDKTWSKFSVDDDRGLICRPPGLRFDTGGTGKGLAADLVAKSLEGYSRFLISCGGDIRIGGRYARQEPFDVMVEHPVSGRKPHLFRLSSGGVATSGINVRAWRRSDGSTAHHLIDPSTGKSCWSGLIGVTALAGSALEAETLAKAALLSGPEGARRILADFGGLIVHESCEVEVIGRVSVKFRIPEIGIQTRKVAA
ncbi:MAG: FAD:protein FMN transferase [Thermoleophilia bacterium]|nr:FAD:protein FMN transferase [Thermoleophilia bacterium]